MIKIRVLKEQQLSDAEKMTIDSILDEKSVISFDFDNTLVKSFPDFDEDGIPDCLDPDSDNDEIPDNIDPNPYGYDELLISEFISDNGDGINDSFNILKINSYPNNILSIYNRSGSLIYIRRNYQNTWPSDQNNQTVPEGSYYFTLDLENNGNIDKRGWIYVSR